MVKDSKHKRGSSSKKEDVIKPKIKVIGIGGGACQALNHMIKINYKYTYVFDKVALRP